jgi:glycosyltransferase involved in cell wall biosynthesis
MKIAYVITTGGGVEPYVRTASSWMLKQGHTVHLVYLGGEPRNLPPAHERLHIHSIAVGPLHYYLYRTGLFRASTIAWMRDYENSRNLAQVLHRINAQHGLDLVELIEGMIRPSLFRGLPFVYKMHGAEWTFRHYCEDNQRFKSQQQAQSKMLYAARQVHSLSRSLADFIAGACDFPRRLIDVTPYPIDTREFTVQAAPTAGPPFRLMTVGRLEKRKGIHTLVTALRQVWQQEADTHLHLFGSNGDFGKPQIEALIPDSEHQGRIHFEGFVPRETLIEHYQKTHVYVAPTRYETFGYTILEAMACGRPVIASDIGPIPELVRQEQTGWVVPRDDATTLAQTIVHALRNPEVCERYGCEGRQFAEKLDIEPVMQRQLSLYRKAVTTAS